MGYEVTESDDENREQIPKDKKKRKFNESIALDGQPS